MPETGTVTGLVLSGGGARASYQAGVVKYVADHFSDHVSPYQVMTGVSAGAINVVALAAGAKDHKNAAGRLWNIWRGIDHSLVFKSDTVSVIANALRFIFNLSLGSPLKRRQSNFLLDTAPLRRLLQKEILFSALRLNIKKGLLKGVAINATNYQSGTNFTFYDALGEPQNWVRSHRISTRTAITIDHVLASTAIPVFFPPVLLGESYFGDGSVRLTSPISPAIHLGAQKILAVGIRCKWPPDMLQELNRKRVRSISMADVAGLLLNSIFADSLDADIERLERINRSLAAMGPEARQAHPDRLRPITLLSINPSVELSGLASDQFDRFPKILRHLLKGIGATRETGSELFSYLSFHHSYTSRVLDLGYEDARAKHDQLREFFQR